MFVSAPVEPFDEEHVLPAMPPDLAPRQYIDFTQEWRVGDLRLQRAAELRDPAAILVRAAESFFHARRATTPDGRQSAEDLGRALADLAVTGRTVYGQFRQGIDAPALELALRQRLGSISPPPADAEMRNAVTVALDRAFAVAWALRGPLAQRATLRTPLGWIATIAEFDPPHRPVNLPAPPYEQYEVPVTTSVSAGTLTLATRFIVACAEPPPARSLPVAAREAPPDAVPAIPGDHTILLFLHGHSSGAEEALEFIPHLHREGLKRGRKYAVIAFDLPNNGYSETFDHTNVAPAAATNFPFLPSDNTPLTTPILDFIENFVAAFVDAIEDQSINNGSPRIKHRIEAVIGGSLGGNLGLRLGRRAPRPSWLRNIVAWSPASVWKAKVKHDPGREASRDTSVEFQMLEDADSRKRYFFRVYEEVRDILGIPITKPQPTYWYGTTFPYATQHVTLSRIGRREIYNRFYRQWHWRVACEQLIFSHFENEVYGDNTTPIRYTLNTVRTLLVAGEEDNYEHVRIYKATQMLGEAMTNCPGVMMPILKTGHSIHFERPEFFASVITDFLQAEQALQLFPAAAATTLLLDDSDRRRVRERELERARTAAVAGAISTLLR